MLDFALVPELGQHGQRGKIVLVLVIPPVELQQIKRVDAHTPQRDGDIVLDNRSGHEARSGYPFGKRLDVGERVYPARCYQLPPELANKIFRWAIMVGEVPGGETGVEIVKHVLERRLRINTPMGTRHLPHPIQDPADAHIKRELKLTFCKKWHGAILISRRSELQGGNLL